MKIIGIGNALVDILLTLEDDSFLEAHKLPRGSMQLIEAEMAEKLLASSALFPRLQASGGSAANTIHGLANLGIETAYIGKIKDDEIGSFFRIDLEKSGITPLLLKGLQPSGTAITFISPDSERTFGTYLGAAVELTPEEITADMIKGYDLLHLEGYLVFNNALVEHIVTLAKAEGVKVSIDLASYNVVEANLGFLRRIVNDYIDIVFANEEEAKAFTGKAPDEALDEIAEMCETAIVKIGQRGSLVKTNNQKYTIGIVDAVRRDTTGAGDLYAAGFLYGLSKNLSPQQCAMAGTILSGKVIEVIGAKISHDVWKKVKALVEVL